MAARLRRLPILLAVVCLLLPSVSIAATTASIGAATPGDGAVALGAGQLHTLLVHADGRLFSCGDNTYGQLGLGDEAPQSGFKPVALGESARAAAGGAYHSLVLTANGKVLSFGRNAFGQLGTGGTVNTSTPQLVSGLPEATAIAAGAYHSLVLGRDGSVWSFGDNTQGQCGPVNGENVQNEAGQLVARRVVRPQRMLDQGARAIAAGAAHSLVLLENGQVLACGANDRGQLGDGTNTGRTTLQPIPGVPPAALIAAGSEHSLIVAGNVYACGDNSLGQLGSGSDFTPAAQARSPVPVDWSKATGSGWNIRILSAGNGNSLLVVDKAGTEPNTGSDPRRTRILLWGSNAYGQLGTGGDASQDRPALLKAIDQGHAGDTFLPVEAVAIGGGHVLIASSRGLLGGAGRNGSGQLLGGGGQAEPVFTGIPLPALETGQGSEPLERVREAALGATVRDSRNPGKVLPLQAPWDSAYAFGEGSVAGPADPRLPFLLAAAALLAVAALLGVWMVISQRPKRPSKTND